MRTTFDPALTAIFLSYARLMGQPTSGDVHYPKPTPPQPPPPQGGARE